MTKKWPPVIILLPVNVCSLHATGGNRSAVCSRARLSSSLRIGIASYCITCPWSKSMLECVMWSVPQKPRLSQHTSHRSLLVLFLGYLCVFALSPSAFCGVSGKPWLGHLGPFLMVSILRLYGVAIQASCQNFRGSCFYGVVNRVPGDRSTTVM